LKEKIGDEWHFERSESSLSKKSSTLIKKSFLLSHRIKKTERKLTCNVEDCISYFDFKDFRVTGFFGSNLVGLSYGTYKYSYA
jgi:hypothetical protein